MLRRNGMPSAEDGFLRAESLNLNRGAQISEGGKIAARNRRRPGMPTSFSGTIAAQPGQPTPARDPDRVRAVPTLVETVFRDGNEAHTRSVTERVARCRASDTCTSGDFRKRHS